MDYVQGTSKYFGSYFQRAPLTCSTWPWHAKEIFKGEFGRKTPTPILFIGNSYDVSTSMNAVHAMEDLFEGSVALEQHGFGVCAVPSCIQTRSLTLLVSSIPLCLRSPTVQSTPSKSTLSTESCRRRARFARLIPPFSSEASFCQT